MKSMYIGSGDIVNLMSGLNTISHGNLLRKFVSDEIPNHNAEASPIDSLRTGAILEERYYEILPENYYRQVKIQSSEMDVFTCSLDFGAFEFGNLIDFDELKTCNFNDFLEFENIKLSNIELIEFIKKKYKHNYNQVQQQLFCTGLNSANLVFLVVYSYLDEDNYNRDIQDNEYIKIRIFRDEEIISEIKKRGKIFQEIKDIYYKK